MGKRIITQRRGRGGPRYRVPSHKFKSNVKYPSLEEYKEGIGGQVIDIIHDPARTAPVARILLENFKNIDIIAPEGLQIGEWVEIGEDAQPRIGSILPLCKIPEGILVYNIETVPGGGGKLVRSAGSFASIVSHEKNTGLTYVRLPSKRIVALNSNARATVGKIAGGGRKDKPMAHAGQAYYAHKAKNKLYPRVCGRAMNAVDHPHGGGRHPHVGKPTTLSRNAPPGRKVGHIAARRTGLKKR